MSQDWLTPLRTALDSGDQEIHAFCRNDDVGWDDAALWPLLATLRAQGVPLDMAVIPTAITDDMAMSLAAVVDNDPNLHLHQHGYRHENHQTQGRKCEFGDARPAVDKAADIAKGAARLRTLFGDRLEPVFTPPWNRCDQDTVYALEAQGFELLSRNLGAKPLQLGTLNELGVTLDWCKKRDGLHIGLHEIADQLAGQVRTGAILGLMFHHAVMQSYDLGALDELLGLLNQSGRIRWHGCLKLSRLLGDATRSLSVQEPTT